LRGLDRPRCRADSWDSFKAPERCSACVRTCVCAKVCECECEYVYACASVYVCMCVCVCSDAALAHEHLCISLHVKRACLLGAL